MPELIAPTIDLYGAWLEAHREWGPGLHEDGFGVGREDNVESSEGFAHWIDRLGVQSNLSIPVAEGNAHCTYRWIVEGDRVLGGIALRHEYTDFVAAWVILDTVFVHQLVGAEPQLGRLGECSTRQQRLVWGGFSLYVRPATSRRQKRLREMVGSVTTHSSFRILATGVIGSISTIEFVWVETENTVACENSYADRRLTGTATVCRSLVARTGKTATPSSAR